MLPTEDQQSAKGWEGIYLGIAITAALRSLGKDTKKGLYLTSTKLSFKEDVSLKSLVRFKHKKNAQQREERDKTYSNAMRPLQQ